LVLRADSAYYQSDVPASVLRRKAYFSVTARLLAPVCTREQAPRKARGCQLQGTFSRHVR